MTVVKQDLLGRVRGTIEKQGLLRAGERVGVVGATGAGKSTIINLLLRFYDVTDGRITLDGVDVASMLLGYFSPSAQ